MDYDLIVVGAGAAGLGAARAGAARGATVLVVSDEDPGGECTWDGCVPSKALIEAAKLGRDFRTAMADVRVAIATIAATENAASLRREGVEFRPGRARLAGPGVVEVDGRPVTCDQCVIATGARAATPVIPGLADVPYLTNETIFDLNARPASLAVLGGGAVGCELAQAFARLGTRVTIVEAASRLMPDQEPEASAVIGEVFAGEGIDVRCGQTVEKVGATTDRIRLTLADGSTVDGEHLLVAAGRTPNTDDLGLDDCGVELDGCGHILTDDRLATSVPGIYAAGDVTGRLPFTHAAFAMGRVAAANAVGRRRQRYRSAATPWVTFTDPEVARVGLTETESANRGGRVAYLPMTEMDRAITAGATEGFVKLIAGPRRLLGNVGGGRVLGATIVAARAGEMIHQPALAMATGMFTGRLAQATTAYPTWSYGVQLAAAQFFVDIDGRTARPATR